MKQFQAEIVREYGPFPEVDAVHGVAFDGQLIWFACGDQLKAIDRGTGVVVDTLDMPATAGTAFDGTHLYQIAGATIRKIDPVTGKVLASIPAPDNGENSGLAWAEGSLWIGHHRGARIHQVDAETGTVLRTLNSDRFVTGVTWIDGELWHGTWQDESSDIRRIDPATGEVLEQLEMPPGIGVSGLESDGGDRFFCGGGNSGRLRVVRRP